MSVTPSSLEIHVHLTDGNVLKFEQDNAEEIKAILDHIQPDRFFTQRDLVIAGTYSMTAFPCSAITRIDLVMDVFPGWSFHFRATDMVEITEEEFRQRYRPEEQGQTRAGRVITPGQPLITFAEGELVNGERLFVEVHLQAQPATPLDRSMMLQQFFSTPGLHCRRRGGGVVLINPANLVRVTFFPGPPETPPNALPAHHLAG